jgi:hypothetical protein
MTKEQFMFLRGLFNMMDLNIPVTNKIQADGIEAFKDLKETFNKDYETFTVAEFEELLRNLESIDKRVKSVQNIFNPINMN